MPEVNPLTDGLWSGRAILKQVKDLYAPYRIQVETQQKFIIIIRFAAGLSTSNNWQRLMEASRISAEQKVKAFESLRLWETESVEFESDDCFDDVGEFFVRSSIVGVDYPPGLQMGDGPFDRGSYLIDAGIPHFLVLVEFLSWVLPGGCYRAGTKIAFIREYLDGINMIEES